MKEYRKETFNDSGYFYVPYVDLQNDDEKMNKKYDYSYTYTPYIPYKRDWKWYFWKFVHNSLIHPFMGFPYEPRWLKRFHDWTSKKCPGGG